MATESDMETASEHEDLEQARRTLSPKLKRAKQVAHYDKSPQRRDSATDRSDTDDDNENSSDTDDGAAAASASKRKKARRQPDEDDDSDVPVASQQTAEERTAELARMKRRVAEDQRTRERAAETLARTDPAQAERQSEGKAGVISRVELFNFMNHSLVTIDLGPRINFLTGHNGSGKSAILTALTVCLGGKASATNRGGSIRDLVKNDRNNGSITVTLLNEGPDAYQPDLFPGRIAIERKFGKDGSSAYSIRGVDPDAWARHKRDNTALGKGDWIVRAKTREELLAITDHFNLQIDNPLNILSQDDARAFLHSSSAKEKYSFFMSGTLLGQLSDDYWLIKSKLEEIVKQCNAKKALLPGVEAMMRKAVAKVKEMKKLYDTHNQVKQLKKELVWAIVEDVEREARDAEKRVRDAETRIPDMERQLVDFDEALKPMDGTIEQLKSKIVDIERQAQPFLHQRDDLKKQIAAKKEESSRLKHEAAGLNDKADAVNAERSSVDEQIVLERERLAAQQSEDARKAALMEKLAELDVAIPRERAQLEQHDQALSNMEAQHHQMMQQKEQLSSQSQMLRHDATRLEQQRAHFEAARRNKDAQFGTFIPNILQEIEQIARKGGWRQRPVGPVGAHISLKDASYGTTVENVLGATYANFIVTCNEDRVTMQSLAQKYNDRVRDSQQQTSVWLVNDYRGSFQLNSQLLPDRRFTSMRDVLDITDDLVLRALVDINKIESVLLFESRQQCEQQTQLRIPDKAKAMYDKQARAMGSKYGHRQISMTGRVGACRLNTDVSRELERVTVALSEKRHELDGVKRRLEAWAPEANALQAEQRRERTAKDAVARNLHRLEAEKKDHLELLRDEEPTTLPTLEAKRESLEREYENYTDAFNAMQLRLAGIKKEMRALDAQMAGLTERLQALNKESDEAKYELEDISNNRKQGLKERAQFEATLTAERQKVAQAEQISRDAALKLSDSLAKANRYCERVQPSAKASALDVRIKAAEDTLRRKEHELGSLDAAMEDMNTRIATYKKAAEEIKATETFNLRLKRAHDLRVERWNQYRDIITTRTKLLFQLQLSRRNFTGRLLMDHEAKTMELKVQTNSLESNTDKRKDPNSLSGGEKSYSQLCLLIAIWSAMESPLRCLDEFDVYMDAANRSICIQMLMEAASSHTGQYVLITPQGITTAKLGPGVKLIKMADPERGQTNLSFAS